MQHPFRRPAVRLLTPRFVHPLVSEDGRLAHFPLLSNGNWSPRVMIEEWATDIEECLRQVWDYDTSAIFRLQRAAHDYV